MNKISEFADIINFWPSCADFGRDIGVLEVTARAMKRRNSISSEYWTAVIDAAKKRQFFGITLEKLAELARHPKPSSAATGRSKNNTG